MSNLVISRRTLVRRAAKNLTPKQKVLKKYPHALAMKRPFGVVIYEKMAFGRELGIGLTSAGAWRDAAAKMVRAASTRKESS